jgi:Predicted membrane protein
MHILAIVIIGFIVGLLARALHPGNDKIGIILTVLLGIAGAFVATWLGQALHFYRPGQNAGFIGAVIGAIIVLVVANLFRRLVR